MTDTFFGSTGWFGVSKGRIIVDGQLGPLVEYDVSVHDGSGDDGQDDTVKITYYDFDQTYMHPFSTHEFKSITDCAISLCNHFGTDFDRWRLTFAETGAQYESETAPAANYG